MPAAVVIMGKISDGGFGGEEDCFVTADGAHGRKCVHALGARGAGHELDGECGDTGGGDFLNHFGRTKGTEETDQELTAAQKW